MKPPEPLAQARRLGYRASRAGRVVVSRGCHEVSDGRVGHGGRVPRYLTQVLYLGPVLCALCPAVRRDERDMQKLPVSPSRQGKARQDKTRH